MNGIHEVTGSIPVWSTNFLPFGSRRGHNGRARQPLVRRGVTLGLWRDRRRPSPSISFTRRSFESSRLKRLSGSRTTGSSLGGTFWRRRINLRRPEYYCSSIRQRAAILRLNQIVLKLVLLQDSCAVFRSSNL